MHLTLDFGFWLLLVLFVDKYFGFSSWLYEKSMCCPFGIQILGFENSYLSYHLTVFLGHSIGFLISSLYCSLCTSSFLVNNVQFSMFSIFNGLDRSIFLRKSIFPVVFFYFGLQFGLKKYVRFSVVDIRILSSVIIHYKTFFLNKNSTTALGTS